MVLIGEVLTQIRNQALDIDAAATNHAVQTQTSQAKNLAVKALAQHLVECLRQKIPVETDHESQARIRELEGQLGDLQQQIQRRKNLAGAPGQKHQFPQHLQAVAHQRTRGLLLLPFSEAASGARNPWSAPQTASFGFQPQCSPGQSHQA